MWALQDARLADGSVVDIAVDGDRIAGVSPGAAAGAGEVVDCRRQLVLPAFIDGHVHLDKALIRSELREHDGTLAGAIGSIHERKRLYTVEDVRGRRQAKPDGVLPQLVGGHPRVLSDVLVVRVRADAPHQVRIEARVERVVGQGIRLGFRITVTVVECTTPPLSAFTTT